MNQGAKLIGIGCNCQRPGISKSYKNPVFFRPKIASAVSEADSGGLSESRTGPQLAQPQTVSTRQRSSTEPKYQRQGYHRLMTLRIIGGELRRRQLKTPPGILTRPYTDRVRQVVFDRLVDRIEDARVADIYAGVGTMGLESISRGAASCVFIEATPLVHQMLKQNVQLLAPEVPTVCWKTDVRYTSFVPRGIEGMLPYSLIYFDPPYARCPDMEPGSILSKSLTRLARPHVSSEDALLLVRTPERFEMPMPAGWQLSECWHVSTMKVWSLTKPLVASSAPESSENSAVDE